jgi:hypothetical protein
MRAKTLRCFRTGGAGRTCVTYETSRQLEDLVHLYSQKHGAVQVPGADINPWLASTQSRCGWQQ